MDPRMVSCEESMVTQSWCWAARGQGLGWVFPVLAHWFVELCTSVSGCRALGFLKLVSSPWKVGLDPEDTY